MIVICEYYDCEEDCEGWHHNERHEYDGTECFEDLCTVFGDFVECKPLNDGDKK